MILAELIVAAAMVVTQPGQDEHEHIVLGAIKLLTATVALIVIGRMLGICIRSIWTTLLSGTEYGTWPGLKKWIGRTSMPNEEKPKLLIHPSSVTLIEQLKKMDLPYEITVDEFCPPGTMHLLDPKHLIHHPQGEGLIWKSQIISETKPLTPEKVQKMMDAMKTEMEKPSPIPVSIEKGAEIVQIKMKSSFSTSHSITQTTFKELGLCGLYPADFDCYCIAQEFHQGEHLWASGQLLSTIDAIQLAWLADEVKLHPNVVGTTEGIWWEGQWPPGPIKPNQQMQNFGVESTEPHHPKTKKWGRQRNEKHQAVLRFLNQELAPFHLEPDETWLEILNPQKFTFDWFVDRLFSIIEDEDYDTEDDE